MTVWADAQTGAPIRIERELEWQGVQTTATMSNFVLNPPLEGPLSGLPVAVGGPASEADLEATLAAYAEATGGEFPSQLALSMSLEDSMHQAQPAVTKLSQSGDPVDQKAFKILAVGTSMVRAASFLNSLLAECDWHYAGADAHLGDADKPVCWWRPPGSATYHVIYADLTEADVQASDLPAE